MRRIVHEGWRKNFADIERFCKAVVETLGLRGKNKYGKSLCIL